MRRFLLSGWFVAMVAVSAILLGRHLVPVPATNDDRALATSLASLRNAHDARPLAVHVLYSECKCSQQIVQHLLTTDRPTDTAEVVLLVGGPSDTINQLETRGFRVIRVAIADLEKRFHVTAVPLLAVVGPAGDLRYAGGYGDRKQSLVIRDLPIIREAISNRPPESLPVFGCAVATELRRRLDPTGVL